MKDPAVIAITLISIIVAAAIIIFAGKSSGDSSDPAKDEAAVFEISGKVFPLTSGAKIQQKDVQIGNSGANPLYLYNFTASEGIKAKIVTATMESPDIIGSRKWKGTLNPNGGGIIRVSFLDKMNWQSPADQYLRFETNDPKNAHVEILFTSDVSKIPLETATDTTTDTKQDAPNSDINNQNFQDLFK